MKTNSQSNTILHDKIMGRESIKKRKIKKSIGLTRQTNPVKNKSSIEGPVTQVIRQR
jgi:hypothetical protein